MRFFLPAGLSICAIIAGCAPEPAPPPPNRVFDGLPITGTHGFAQAMGFSRCVDIASALRCRKGGVTLFGTGPYEAAVDLDRNGRSGFGLLTLWHDGNQSAVFAISDSLGARGWRLCRTGWADRGDQEIWTKPGARIRVMMDLSYWSKRRIRVLPEQGQPTGRCW